MPRSTSSAGKFARSPGPSLYIGIYRSRYSRAARPAGLAVLRIGEGAISARFERRCSVRCPSRLTILTKPRTAHLDQSFVQAANCRHIRSSGEGPIDSM